MLDGMISIGGATAELAQHLERLGPFGQGNPSIRLAVQNVVNLKPEVVGEHHVKTLLIDRLSNARLSAIAFRVMGTKLGDALLSTRGKTIDVAGQLRLQEWNGKQTVSLQIEDIAYAAFPGRPVYFIFEYYRSVPRFFRHSLPAIGVTSGSLPGSSRTMIFIPSSD